MRHLGTAAMAVAVVCAVIGIAQGFVTGNGCFSHQGSWDGVPGGQKVTCTSPSGCSPAPPAGQANCAQVTYPGPDTKSRTECKCGSDGASGGLCRLTLRNDGTDVAPNWVPECTDVGCDLPDCRPVHLDPEEFPVPEHVYACVCVNF